MPDEQTLLVQSDAIRHVLPSAHAEQLPPQSELVSSPLRMPSEQEGALQVLLKQTLLVQSLAVAHRSVSAQVALQLPPQSISASLLSRTSFSQSSGPTSIWTEAASWVLRPLVMDTSRTLRGSMPSTKAMFLTKVSSSKNSPTGIWMSRETLTTGTVLIVT